MKRFVFSPFDILVPWAVCLVSAGFCVLAAMKAPTAPGRYISLTVGVFFLVGIGLWYLMRWNSRKPDFMVGNMGVVWGKLNHPAKYNIESLWLPSLTEFWSGKVVRLAHDSMTAVTITPFMIRKACDGLLVICYDADQFSFWGRMVAGYSFGKDVALGFKAADTSYTASLFRHEVSHQILDAAGVMWDEARHHKIFQDVGLGA